MSRKIHMIAAALCFVMLLCGCDEVREAADTLQKIDVKKIVKQIDTIGKTIHETAEWISKLEGVRLSGVNGGISLDEIPEYQGEPYTVINDNIPGFSEEALTTEAYEWYSMLDPLGRCGSTEACIGGEIMPTEERGPIGQVKPAGWHTVKYDNIDGLYLYNRCHLIGYQLTGENANERNLITGTRYLNVEGMLPFENEVAEYIAQTGNHVLYRVTPIYEGTNLLCHGLQMEAYSVEDKGRGVCFNVFVYNVQPGIEIDYQTGKSRRAAS